MATIPGIEEFVAAARGHAERRAKDESPGRGGATREYEVLLGDTPHHVRVTGADGRYEVRVGDLLFHVDSRRLGGGRVRSLLVNDRSIDAEVEPDGPNRWQVALGGHELAVEVRDRLAAQLARQMGGTRRRTGPEVVTSPMPGLVVSIHVNPGDVVPAGGAVAVVEAMKMQNELTAHHGGRVSEVRASPGQAVESGQALVVIVPENA